MSAIATDRRVGVIGMGHMAEALVSGAISAGVIMPDRVICSRRGGDALTRIADEMGVGVTRDNAEVVASSDLVLLSVKPQQLQDVMPRLSAQWRAGQVLVSVMAGVTLARLEAQSEPDVVIVAVRLDRQGELDDLAIWNEVRHVNGRPEFASIAHLTPHFPSGPPPEGGDTSTASVSKCCPSRDPRGPLRLSPATDARA